MSGLLELRDKIRFYYRKYEFILYPTMKFMLAYLAICCVNGAMGYMTQIDKVGIVLIASLVCSFMPIGFVLFVTSVFGLLHMYALSIEVALVGACIYFILLLLFVRFDSSHSILLVVTAVCAAMKIPYVIPIAVGLLATPMAAVSVGCGLTVHALIKVVSDNAVVINGMGKGEEIAKVKMIIDAMLRNKEMMIMIIAFAITIAVVYMIRRMSIEHSWTIAMVAGAILNIVIILIGDLKYDTQVSVFGVFVTSLLALAIAKLLEFMFFCVDYSRTEKVQFEDDEYYYYVKAIPKMNVAVQSKTVKKINTQKSSGARRSAAPARTGQRSMMTERTDLPKRDIQRSANEKKISSGGRSVTIGNYIDEDDFEDLD